MRLLLDQNLPYSNADSAPSADRYRDGPFRCYGSSRSHLTVRCECGVYPSTSPHQSETDLNWPKNTPSSPGPSYPIWASAID